jgi:hypothetical protein
MILMKLKGVLLPYNRKRFSIVFIKQLEYSRGELSLSF